MLTKVNHNQIFNSRNFDFSYFHIEGFPDIGPDHARKSKWGKKEVIRPRTVNSLATQVMTFWVIKNKAGLIDLH